MKKQTFFRLIPAVFAAAFLAPPANAYGVIWKHTLESINPDGNIGVIFNLKNKAQAQRWAKVQCERSEKERRKRWTVPKGTPSSCQYLFFENECYALQPMKVSVPDDTMRFGFAVEYRQIHISGRHQDKTSAKNARKAWRDTCMPHNDVNFCNTMKIRAGCDTDNSGKHHYGTSKSYQETFPGGHPASLEELFDGNETYGDTPAN